MFGDPYAAMFFTLKLIVRSNHNSVHPPHDLMHFVVNLLRDLDVSPNRRVASADYYRRDSYHELPLELLVDTLARRSSLLNVLPGVVAVHRADAYQAVFRGLASAIELFESGHGSLLLRIHHAMASSSSAVKSASKVAVSSPRL
jgi:hypothetical protein